MPTLFEVGAFRVVIFFNDHGPAHVHALGPGGHARFILGASPEDVVLTETDGIPRAALRKIAARIIDGHGECLRVWEKYHGKQGSGRQGG